MHELYWYWKMGASSPANVTCAYQTWNKVFFKRKFKKGQAYTKKPYKIFKIVGLGQLVLERNYKGFAALPLSRPEAASDDEERSKARLRTKNLKKNK